MANANSLRQPPERKVTSLMRTKLTLPALAFALATGLAVVFALAGIPSSSGYAEDDYEERLSALETRVAALEVEVGIAETTPGTSQSSPTDQQGNVSSSSSQTNVSSSSSTGMYSATFTSSGDNTIEFEIDTPGTYSLAVSSGSAYTVELVGPDGKLVEGFSLVSDQGGTETTTGELKPGLHTLRVQADAMWSATVMSADS